MNVPTALLILSTAAAVVAPLRSAQIALACESGCATADSVQVADAIRTGLAHHGVTVTQQSLGREFPLLVTGRITIQGDSVRVAAELLELHHEISRYTVLAPRTELSAQVLRMGERFGRALLRP